MVNDVDQQLAMRDELLHKLKTNLQIAVNRMKQLANWKRRDVSVNVGDNILLKLHHYRQHSTFNRIYQKLASRFYGPYPILEKIEPIAYKLDLPPSTRIHPMFHVSLLKQYHQDGNNSAPQTGLPPFTGNSMVELVP